MIEDMDTKFIVKQCGHYQIRHKVNGKQMYFGTYPSLREAQLFRDYFEEKGWENCLDERKAHSISKYKDVKNPRPSKNIVKTKYGYQIIKTIKKKSYCFGTYPTLENAKEIRDLFESNGWDLFKKDHYLPKKYIVYNKGRYVIRKTLNGKREYIASFDTLEKAEEEVECYKKCNWSLDAVCESIDETVNGEPKMLEGVRKGTTIFYEKKANGRDDSHMMRRSGIPYPY